MLRLKIGNFLGENKRTFDLDGVVVSETVYRQKVFEGWHAHENHHVTFVLRGGNREQRRGTSRIDFEAVPGSVLFYRPNETHRNQRTLHPSKNLNLEIGDAFLKRYDAAFSANFPAAAAKFTLLKIYREVQNLGGDENSSPASAASVHALILALLAGGGDDNRKNFSEKPLWIKRLGEIIHDRWDEVLTLDELSREVGVHPVTISAKFPKFFSCTFGEYARRVKIEKALELIGKRRFSLTEIAHLCGFTDQSHFTRSFKKLTDFLPGELRRNL